VDDISGIINYVKEKGIGEIYLVGHSTGCQKIAYYLSRKNHSQISGAVLIAPMSDYAASLKLNTDSLLEKQLSLANDLLQDGKPNELLFFNTV